MASFCEFLSQGLRGSRSDYRVEKAPCPERNRAGLVECSHEFRQGHEGKTAITKFAEGDRETGDLPSRSRHTSTPEAACFDNLPGDQPGNAER
jgi:hypothetical protein